MEATMMGTRYKRAMAPLDAKARARLWDGCGDAAAIAVGHEGSTGKLEELVRAFYNDEVYHRREKAEEKKEIPSARWRQALEVKLNDAAAEPVAEWIRAKAEAVVGAAGLECDELVRRRLVRRMQDRGLDAGICKSRWHNISGIPAGSHEYIDALVGDARYIVEINLSGEFKIARPTKDYMELLSYLPKVFVGRPATLEAVIKLMCLAAGESIKRAGMHLPPWRRRKYMNEKWFSDYQRYTDMSPSSSSSSSSDAIGRMPLQARTANQRCWTNSFGATGSSKLKNDLFLRGRG